MLDDECMNIIPLEKHPIQMNGVRTTALIIHFYPCISCAIIRKLLISVNIAQTALKMLYPVANSQAIVRRSPLGEQGVKDYKRFDNLRSSPHPTLLQVRGDSL